MGRRGPLPSIDREGRRTRRRPAPPPDLTPPQAEMWRQIVATEPASLFDSEALCHLLRLYVEHAAFRAEAQALIAATPLGSAMDDDAVARLDRLLRIRDRETKLLVSLATRLRLTNQSRYTPQAAASAGRNDGGDVGEADDPAAGYFN